MGIQAKLFTSLLLSFVILIGLMVFALQWSLDRDYLAYTNAKQLERFRPVASELEGIYQQNGWTEMSTHTFHEVLQRHALANQPPGPGPTRPDQARPGPNVRDGFSGPPHENRHSNRPDARGDRPRPEMSSGIGPRGPGPRMGPDPMRGGLRPPPVGLVDADKNYVAGARFTTDQPGLLIPIRDNSDVIGFITVRDEQAPPDQFELQLIEQQREAILLAGIVVVLIALFVSWLLANGIVTPIRKIASATSELTEGRFQIGLELSGKDEFSQLGRDILELSETLDRSRKLRQQWLADTSHELRTPLAIIKGEVEAMLDGVRDLNMDRVRSLSQEVNQLHQLVEDLADLANADMGGLSYRKQELELLGLFQDKFLQIASICQDADLQLELNMPDGEMLIWADEVRINQLLDNLLTNTVKYTSSPGHLRVSVIRKDQKIKILWQDSAPGVPDEALPRLFDHLFRAEQSRNRKFGGSGIGLAIVDRVVQAHEGRVSASHSPLGGILIEIEIPEFQV